jgi:uncharacterized membrane protein YedE/YeeE
MAGWLDVEDARQLAARGSLSGAAVGGAMFGIGMILARGCSSRLLVLAAQGNLQSACAVVGTGLRRDGAVGAQRALVADATGDLRLVDGGGR